MGSQGHAGLYADLFIQVYRRNNGGIGMKGHVPGDPDPFFHLACGAHEKMKRLMGKHRMIGFKKGSARFTGNHLWSGDGVGIIVHEPFEKTVIPIMIWRDGWW